MPRVTLVFAVLLIILGVIGYLRGNVCQLV